MLLASNLNPSGPKSNKHFIILHHNDTCDLVETPKTYQELEDVVSQLYGIRDGGFYIETDDLNVCCGTRVKVPKLAWAGVNELLGNIFISADKSAARSPVAEHARWEREVAEEVVVSPTRPETVSMAERSAPIAQRGAQDRSTTRGEITLAAPFANEGVLVFHIANIDFASVSNRSTVFHIQLFDTQRTLNLKAAITLQSDSMAVSSGDKHARFGFTFNNPRHGSPQAHQGNGHTVIFYERDGFTTVLCDFNLAGRVVTPQHSPNVLVKYTLGNNSPFKGPFRATAFNSLAQFGGESQVYRSMFPVVEREKLYHEIMAFNPDSSSASGIADRVSKALAIVRNEFDKFGYSSADISGAVHRAVQGEWTSVDCRLHPRKILLLRYIPERNIAQADPDTDTSVADFDFGNDTLNWLEFVMGTKSLQIFSQVSQSQRVRLVTVQLSADHDYEAEAERTILILAFPAQFKIFVDFKDELVVEKRGGGGGGQDVTRFKWSEHRSWSAKYELRSVALDVYDFGSFGPRFR